MAARGMRVLGVARAAHSGAEFPATQCDFNFELIGIVGLADPLRARCSRCGYRFDGHDPHDGRCPEDALEALDNAAEREPDGDR